MVREVERGEGRRRVKVLRRGVVPAIALACLVAGIGPSGAEEDTPPGLPPPPPPPPVSQLTATSNTSINESAPSRQWYRLPDFHVVARTLYPRPDEFYHFINDVFVISPKGAPEPFGYFPKFEVRSVTFGVVPAVITVQLSQVRDSKNYPVPWDLTQTQDVSAPGETHDAILDGDLQVTVTKLVVDGQNVPLGKGCSTVSPAHLRLVGEGGYVGLPGQGQFGVLFGGPVSGNVDVPAFGSCGGQDDVGLLLTSMISAKVNHTSAYVSAQTPNCAPGILPEITLDCVDPKEWGYPTRENPKPTYPYS